MKKILVISLGLCILSMRGSAVSPSSFTDRPFDALTVRITEFLRLSPKELETLTGKKLSFTEKISLRIIKGRMKKAVRKNPGLTVMEFMISQKRKNAGSAILYILLGALLVFFFLFLVLFTDSDR